MHISITYIILYAFAGITIGITYGLLFLLQKKGALLPCARRLNPAIRMLGFTIVRFFLLFTALYYLLPLSTQALILVMISFFVGFWTTITRSKGI